MGEFKQEVLSRVREGKGTLEEVHRTMVHRHGLEGAIALCLKQLQEEGRIVHFHGRYDVA